MNKKSFSFPIVSPSQIVSLPRPILCNHIRFNQVGFKFSVNNKKLLTVSINSFDNNIYFDGVNHINYSWLYFNDGGKTSVSFINNLDCYDCSFETRNINSLEIVSKIDNTYDSLLISPENPLFLSLDFYYL